MFQRRKKVSTVKKVTGLVWPAMGWRRVYHYYTHRIGRLPGTPYFIASGFATGAAMSFTPFVGFHLILSAAIAFLLRGSLLASAVGTTMIGNPWTFPIIWYVTYETGISMMHDKAALGMPVDFSIQFIWKHSFELLVPMAIGSLPFVAGTWILMFFLVYGGISSYRDRRRFRRK